MKFCNQCGNAVNLHIPEGDDRHRHVCGDCETIHYQNPNIIAGCLATYQGKVLLCKRAIEPRHGFWTLPAGFMENNESVEEGAMRETWEEAQAKVELQGLYTLFSLPEINQVYMIYRGKMTKPEFGAGIESLEVELFSEAEIPWDQLAFPVMKKTLRHFFEDRKTEQYPLRSEALYRPKGSKPKDNRPEV
jgi:ADP-ribose pyrophosphatase YjhB (NUDIX family)